VLIVVPPSELKRPPAPAGDPVDLAALSFPELSPTRRRVIDALMATSAREDAFRRLGVRPSRANDVAQNTWLLESPAIPVLDLYVGPLHDGLDAARLSKHGSARLERSVVVGSALWGLLRPLDRIPPYRLHVNAWLVGIDRIDATWRAVLPPVLAAAASAAGGGVILDLRSIYYQAMGLPAAMSDGTVALRIDQGPRHRIGDVIAKRVRGEAAHFLLEGGEDPKDPDALAELLADRWPTRLEPPERPGRSWTLTLTIDG
jgi:cytoplasmic iron level regulating protein YaaA (DUF328/UPF0246 family)